MNKPSAAVTMTLDAAASLLLSVGRADPDRTDAGVTLHCLLAADQLRAAGAHATRGEIDPVRIREAIREAMTGLATLPPAVFAQNPVVDAAASARTALELLDDR